MLFKVALSLLATTSQALEITFSTSTPCMNESLTVREVWTSGDTLMVIMEKAPVHICMTAIGTGSAAVIVDDSFKGFK